ncbi:hypothetical protein E2C01_082507 [Portunus trituberculatus]|uniref:Uncharacterized protein n=1 Tax=Portunus trituberculatus TaxID=210409 RepID=A0A5B7J121_PORTR|nr:hypothetical protein [Portunus trituberculatus]
MLHSFEKAYLGWCSYDAQAYADLEASRQAGKEEERDDDETQDEGEDETEEVNKRQQSVK